MSTKALSRLGLLALLLALAVAHTSASHQADDEPLEATGAADEAQVEPASRRPYKREPNYEGDQPYYGSEGPYHDDSHYHYKKQYGYGDKVYWVNPPTPPPVCPFCPENLTECLSPVGTPQCLDLMDNPYSCGKCNNVCPQFSTCVEGNCTCFEGLTLCGDKCVDLTNDNNFCGDCFTPCDTANNQVCVNGTCVEGPPPCGPGQTACFPSPNANGTCTFLNNDTDACGSCKRRCPAQALGVQCVEGECCIPNGNPCLLAGVGLLCCGFNPLSLIPGPIPSATCEARGIFGGVCCYGVGKGCSVNSECCSDLICRDLPLIGKTCQPNCGIFGDNCNINSDCCSNNCVNLGILGKKCA